MRTWHGLKKAWQLYQAQTTLVFEMSKEVPGRDFQGSAADDGIDDHRFEIDVFSQIEPRLLKEYENYRQGIIVDDPYCPVKSTLPTGIITTVEKGKHGEDVVVRKIKVVDPRTGKMK